MRVSKIVSLVRKNLILLQMGDDVKEQDVLYHLELCQTEVARRSLALTDDASVTTVVSQEAYTLDPEVHRVIEIIEPAAWSDDLTIVTNPKDWKRIKRDTSYTTGAIQPLFAFFWSDELRLYPVPTTIVTLSLLVAVKPTLSLVIDSPQSGVETANPELSSVWDTALYYGTMQRILAVYPMRKNVLSIADFNALFEAELARLIDEDMDSQLIEPHTKDSSEEGVYF